MKLNPMEGKNNQLVNDYEPMAGENVETTAEHMIALAKEKKRSVRAKFNDVELVVTEDSTVEDIVSGFEKKTAEAGEAYRNSPEGQRAARESEERKEKMQGKADTLMEQLPNLDFSNQEAVLDWICEFQDPSDYIGVAKDRKKVLEIFAEHGYQPGVNTGEAFNGEDSDNFAHYVVGQALSGLQRGGSIHQVVHRFADDWKKKFAS